MTASIEPPAAPGKIVHATAVAIDGHAVLIVGPSGSGKSDLALRLIDRGAVLIADDRVCCTLQGSAIIATCPATIRGLIEIRGLGLVEVNTIAAADVRLVLRLDPRVERHPERRHHGVLGVLIEEVAVAAFEASTPIKVERALRRALSGPDDGRDNGA